MRSGRLRETVSRPCVNCLACADVCPAGLYPARLYHTLRSDDLDAALAGNLRGCIQCGLCGMVCPASLPLHIRLARGLKEATSSQAEASES